PILYFFLIAPSTTEIYTLSLHDALPIYPNASKLLLSGHTDTVKIGAQKWDYDPFKGDIAHGKLHGRGTTDMKSGLAALYLALESLIEENYEFKKDIEFLATAGEEVDSIGAEHYVKNENM